MVKRIGIDIGDRFSANARKVKFVISGMPEDSEFPVKFTDFQVSYITVVPTTISIPPHYHLLCHSTTTFIPLHFPAQVVHHYLHSAQKEYQTRLRKRVRNGRATFTFTVRKPELQVRSLSTTKSEASESQRTHIPTPSTSPNTHPHYNHNFCSSPLSLPPV